MRPILVCIYRTGRAEINHHKPIPNDTLDAIWKLCSSLEKLLEARKSEDAVVYETSLQEIPIDWRDKYNELLRICIQFIITLLDVRRGIEGLELLTKGHFKLREEDGNIFFEKVSCNLLRFEKFENFFHIVYS